MPLISKYYLQLQSTLHSENPAYGSSGHLHAGWITRTMCKYGGTRVLDYGCGKQTLKASLPKPYEYIPYDPAFLGIHTPPPQADLVAALDVMEHIEPECLEDVLKDIRRAAQLCALMVISTRPASKIMADGRNAHLIQQPPIWWFMRVDPYFDIQNFSNAPMAGHFFLELTPR